MAQGQYLIVTGIPPVTRVEMADRLRRISEAVEQVARGEMPAETVVAMLDGMAGQIERNWPEGSVAVVALSAAQLEPVGR